jgi:hypothetical protein
MSKSDKAKKRKKRISFIARTVLTGGANLAPEMARKIALKVIDKNKKKLQKFVADKAMIQPSDNPEELAMQVAQTRESEIQKIADDPTNDANTIEDASDVFENEQAEQIETESYDGESDAFTEEAIGAVIGIAKGAVQKIKEKRLASGKKFLGKTKAQWDAKSGADVSTDGSGNIVVTGATNPKSKDPLSMAIADAQGGATDTLMKKYLPIAIIVIVVIAFVMMKKK